MNNEFDDIDLDQFEFPEDIQDTPPPNPSQYIRSSFGDFDIEEEDISFDVFSEDDTEEELFDLEGDTFIERTTFEDFEEDIVIDVDLDEFDDDFDVLEDTRSVFDSLRLLYKNLEPFNRRCNVLTKFTSNVDTQWDRAAVSTYSKTDISALSEESSELFASVRDSFRRKLKNGDYITVDDFMNLPSEEIGFSSNKKIKDFFPTNTGDYQLVVRYLKNYRDEAIKKSKELDEKRSRKNALGIMHVNNVIEHYEDLPEIVNYLETIISVINNQDRLRELRGEELVDQTLESIKNSIAYLKEYDIGTKTAVCGSCGEVFDLKFDVFKYISFDHKNGSYSVPGVNYCPHCKTMNILKQDDYLRLEESGKLPDVQMSDLCYRINKLSPSFNYIKYTLGAEKENELVNSTNVNYNSSISLKVESDKLSLDGAIKRYKRTLKSFEEPEIKAMLDIPTPNPSLIKGANFISVYTGTNYSSEKSLAIVNIINHLSSSSGFNYGYYFRYSEYARLQGIVASKGILDKLTDLKDNDFYNFAKYLYSIFHVPINLDSIVNFDRDYVLSVLRKEYKKQEEKFEDFKTKRKHYMEMIRENLNNLSNLYIAHGSVDDYELLDFICMDDMRLLIDEWADLMVINNNLEDFATYAYTGTSRFKADFYKKSFSNSFGFYSMIASKLDKVYGVEVEPKSLAHSIYPSNNMASALNKIIEVHSAFLKGRYLFYLSLEEFLKSVPAGDPFIKQSFGAGKLLEKVSSFLDKHGRSSIDILSYYYGKDFTREEIEEVCSSGFIPEDSYSNYVLDRKDGESFADYLNRMESCKDIRFEDYHEITDDLIEFVREYYVQLDAVYVTAMACFGNIKNINHYFAYKTMIQALLEDSKANEIDIIELMKINKVMANDLLNTSDTNSISFEYDKYKTIVDCLSFIYLDTDLNNNLFGNTYLERFNYLSKVGFEDASVDESKEVLETLAPHLTKEERDMIYEFISVGEPEC